MSRFLMILSLTFSLALAGACSAADDTLFNVDVFFGWDFCYRPMEWTPIVVRIDSTLTEPFDGRVIISSQQDELNTLNITHDFVLTPGMPQELPLVTKIAFMADKCDVRIQDKKKGRTVWRQTYNFWDRTWQGRAPTSVEEIDMFIGLIGRRTFSILRLPRRSICQSDQGQGRSFSGRVYLQEKTLLSTPWDWTGFESLDLLVLYDPDWNKLRRDQLSAISQWVSKGGTLLIVLGVHPMASNNSLAAILPTDVGQIQEMSIPRSTLENWGLSDVQAETVKGWPLRPKPDAHLYQADQAEGREHAFLAAKVGFGRIGVLAFDPTSLSEGQQANAAEFWAGRFAAVLEDNEPASIQADRAVSRQDRRSSREQVSGPLPVSRTIRLVDDSDAFMENQQYRDYRPGGAYAAGNAVMEHLYKGIRPLSIWWVILLLTALAVLLGPVDYIVLKRKDRLPLTWVTCTFWIALFTVGAYYGVQAVRAGDMELRVVSVVDAIQDCNAAWSTDYCGLFAPRSAEYKLIDTEDNQWWSGIAPTPERFWSPPTGSNRIYCQQRDGFNLPYSLPVSIWTIQCLMKESPAVQLPFSAQVRRQGNDVIVDVTNNSEVASFGGYALLDEDVGINLGAVLPGETRQFTGRLSPTHEWSDNNVMRYNNYYGRRGQMALDPESAFFSQGTLARTEAMKRYLRDNDDAAVVCVFYDKAPLPYRIDSRLCKYDHMQLARLVVFPQQSN